MTKLADATGFSRATAHKIDQWCGKSPEPEFEPGQTNVLGLYLSPPKMTLVISVDEKCQIQALDRTRPMLPGGPIRLGDRLRSIADTKKKDLTGNAPEPDPCNTLRFMAAS